MSIQKVLLHNLSIDYTQPSVGLFDFDQNALFFAESGDVVVSRKKISEAYLTFLTQCGLNFAGVNFVSSELDNPSTMEDIFQDESIVKQLKLKVDPKRKTVLDCFILTDKEAKWADAAGVTFVGNPLHERFGGKSYFRGIAKKNGFPVAFGFENQSGALDGAIKACLIFLRGFSELVVKYDEGSVALDSRRFSKEEFLRNFTKFEQYLAPQFFHRVVPKFSKNFAIEGWYKEALLSPSIQINIDPAGSVEVISTHVQLLYDDKMQYKGCAAANYMERETEELVEREGRALAAVFAKEGYCGNIAFDALILPKNKLIWEELNPRKTMTSYSFQIAKKLCGKEKMLSKYYVSQYVQKSAWKGKTIEELLVILAPVLFSKEKGSGMIPFNYGLLASEGRISIIAFSDSKDSIQQLFNYIDSL